MILHEQNVDVAFLRLNAHREQIVHDDFMVPACRDGLDCFRYSNSVFRAPFTISKNIIDHESHTSKRVVLPKAPLKPVATIVTPVVTLVDDLNHRLFGRNTNHLWR